MLKGDDGDEGKRADGGGACGLPFEGAGGVEGEDGHDAGRHDAAEPGEGGVVAAGDAGEEEREGAQGEGDEGADQDGGGDGGVVHAMVLRGVRQRRARRMAMAVASTLRSLTVASAMRTAMRP